MTAMQAKGRLSRPPAVEAEAREARGGGDFHRAKAGKIPARGDKSLIGRGSTVASRPRKAEEGSCWTLLDRQGVRPVSAKQDRAR